MPKSTKNVKSDDSKVFAFLAMLLSALGFVIAYAVKKEDRYVMFYAKQSLALFFAWLIVWIVGLFLAFIPFLGSFIVWLADLCLIVLWAIGLIYSLSGEQKEIPIIGQFADNFNF
jgi:uncharacterized membrane protein